MERKRLIHELESPYSTVQWPQIAADDQDTILELLCSLLGPLGDFRRNYLVPSRGKRHKRKLDQQTKTEANFQKVDGPKPPLPELAAFVDVGLASISRGLQGAATLDVTTGSDRDSRAGLDHTPYVAVFVARSGHSSAFHSHLPQMVAVASESRPEQPPIRLVGFSKACEDRLSQSLGIPRVSSVALRSGAPLSQALLGIIYEKVPIIEVAWLKEVIEGYRETRIKTIESRIGPKKQKAVVRK